MTKRFGSLVGLTLMVCASAFAGSAPQTVGSARQTIADWETPDVKLASIASGLGVNLAAIGYVPAGPGKIFETEVNVQNNTTSATQIDVYFDGVSAGSPIAVTASISSAGALVAQGAGGLVRGHFNAHFDDFVDALVKAGLIPASVETSGILGSALFVFNGYTKSGQGSAVARFYVSACGGTVGQAINGREVTNAERTKIITYVRDSRGLPGPQLYPNLFVNNMGLTPTGSGTATAVDVKLSAFSNSTGNPVGTPKTISGLGTGQTALIGNVLSTLGVPAGEDTILVLMEVVSGNAAIDGGVVELDATSGDGTSSSAANGSF